MSQLDLADDLLAEVASTTCFDWGGFPVSVNRSPEQLVWKEAAFRCHSVSMVLTGRCYSEIQTGRKRRGFYFSPGSFFSLSPGIHCDQLIATGSVLSITIEIEADPVCGTGQPLLNTPWFRDAGAFALCRSIFDSHGSISPDRRLVSEELSILLQLRLENLGKEVSAPPKFFPRPALSVPRQRRIIDYLDSHLGDELSVTSLSSLVALSPSQFAIAFRHTFSRSVHQFILDARLGRARELLKSRQTAIADIAHQCGFSSQSHLTTAFGRATGMTPLAFRRMHALTLPLRANTLPS